VNPRTMVLVGNTVQVDNVVHTLETVLAKAFGPGRGVAVPGIDTAFLDRAMAVVDDFAATEAFLEEKFAGHGQGRVSAQDLFGNHYPDLASVAKAIPGSL